MMKRTRIALVVFMAVVAASPAAATSRARKAAAKKEEKALLAKPIEPMPPREDKPRAGWGGAYGGLNGGSGFSDR
jgi:hypothetical protein